MDEIFDKLKKVTVEVLSIDEERIIPSATFRGDLEVDSLDLIEFVTAIEEEFNIEIPDEDADKIITVQDAVDYLKCRK